MSPRKHFTILSTLVSLTFATSAALAADAQKVKVLDSCDKIDPKATVLSELKAKVVPTTDPAHPKAMEVSIDYAKPGTYPNFGRKFAPGMLDPKKYSALRFFVRSNSGTSFTVQFHRPPRTDEKLNWFYGGVIEGKPEWTQITIPLENFKRGGGKIWKNGAQLVLPGGDPFDADDYANINELKFVSTIDRRGSATVGHLMFDAIELVEK